MTRRRKQERFCLSRFFCLGVRSSLSWHVQCRLETCSGGQEGKNVCEVEGEWERECGCWIGITKSASRP